MRISVRGIAHFKELLESLVGPIVVPDRATLQDLLVLLGDRLGDGFKEQVIKSGAGVIYPPLRTMVNGRDIGPQKRPEYVLQDGDDVLLLTPLGGG